MTTLDDAQEKGIVIGLSGETDKPVSRLDVDELLLEHPKTFNLFLLALVDLQDAEKSRNDKMGYFQVAGMTNVLIMYHIQANYNYLLCRYPWISIARLGQSTRKPT